jgi:hypothetical protein
VGCRPQPIFLSTESTENSEFFLWVAALTKGLALAKFLCAKIGFTFSVGGDMERRRLAGMKPASLSHH